MILKLAQNSKPGYFPHVNMRFFPFIALLGYLGGTLRAAEPPLPGEEGTLPPPASSDFQPLLQPGEELPPGTEAPHLPDGPAVMPPELFPENMPGVSDGTDGLPMDQTLDYQLHPPDSSHPSLLPPGTLPDEAPLLPAPATNLNDVTLPGLQLAARAHWHRSPREAREISKKERKPLLIFFRQKWKSGPAGPNQGVSSDPNIAINDDLLSTQEFNEFAASRVVLTSLFYPIGSPGKEFTPEHLAALKQFKEYFNVKGFPTVILLDEKGNEIERLRGYARIKTGPAAQEYSAAPPLLERLRRAVEKREKTIADQDERMNRLIAQNYRQWTSKAGSKLFAKLVAATPEEAVLMDENGALVRVAMAQLWIVDQAWIRRQQKAEK